MKWVKRGTTTNIKDMFLKNLGVSSLEDVNDWFRRSYANNYKIKNLDAAVSFAKEFRNKKVTIIGDYDVDGVAATSILTMALKEYGFTNVSYRIPRRFSEGFGINDTIINEINEGLIITCDNGIAGISAIRKAKEKGLSVIVTDHHEPVVDDRGNVILPEADYIIDPNALPDTADFNGYCGAGLAYKFICELFSYDKRYTKKYLGLAAIGTVADVMKLHEENYVFVKNGLKALAVPELCTTGLTALLSVFNITRDIKASDIAYRIGPAINSSSRMNDSGATDAVELLTFNGSMEEALRLANKLKATNELRKIVEKETYEKALSIIESENRQELCPLTLYIPDAHEGVIGIVASSLCEDYCVPTLIFTNITDCSGTFMYKGSARSCGDYHIKQAFDRNASFFVKYGGHAEAAGMTILPENFDVLTKALNNDCHGFTFPDKNVLYYDLELKPREVAETIKLMKSFEPYGEGNPEPVIRLAPFIPYNKEGNYRKIIGKNQDTIKINSSYLEALGFRMAPMFAGVNEKSPLAILGRLSENVYNGTVTPQILMDDFKITY